MPALIPTDHTCEIVWLGLVPPGPPRDIEAHRVEALDLTFAGAVGDRHTGELRPSCSRVTRQYAKGTLIRNTRQISIVSEEELAIIAERIGIDVLDPGWIGATMSVRGLPDFSHIPPSARLQGESGGATMTVDMQNRPCGLAGKGIELARPGHGKNFNAVARGLRGITTWVEREGRVTVGETLRLHIPDQRAWKP